MPLSINEVRVAGNLTRDVETRCLMNERTVANFGLAVNERWRSNDGEQQEKTHFLEVEVFGRQAETCGQYLSKGKAVYIAGSLDFQQWQDNDGGKRSALKIKAQRVQFLSAPDDNRRQQPQQPSAPAVPPPADLDDDGVPF